MRQQDLSSRQRKLFVSINDYSGHDQDMRWALNQALNPHIPFYIFQDASKKPEQLFYVLVEAIILCNGAILDATPSTGSNSVINPDILIQFGICYATGKQFWLLSVDPKAFVEKDPGFLDGYITQYRSYIDLADTFIAEAFDWNTQQAKRKRRQTAYGHNKSKSFSVFGLNPDIYRFISSFISGTDWHPRYSRRLDSRQVLKSLAEEIGDRPFCVFCLEPSHDSTVYFETHIALGLAIGMGVPFFILYPEDFELPKILQGYDATIQYRQFTDVETKLQKFAQTFLSSGITSWHGSTFPKLVARAEQQVGQAVDTDCLDEQEQLLNAIIASVDNPPPTVYAALGDIYQVRFYKFDSEDIALLKLAQNYYRQAPELVRCQDSIEVIEKQIELFELLKEGKYRSIPQLIRLVGEDLTLESYAHLRAFLLQEVQKLIDVENYLLAINLLSAMQIHDKSKEISDLIAHVFNMKPDVYLEAFLEAQVYIAELEDRERNLIPKVNHLETKVTNLETKANRITTQLHQTQLERDQFKSLSERLQVTNQELAERLARFDEQLQTVREDRERLIFAYEQLTPDDLYLRNRFESERQFSGRAVLVNFGLGWAIYTTLGGEPSVLRNGIEYPAEEGFVFQSEDIVYHSGGAIEFKNWFNYRH